MTERKIWGTLHKTAIVLAIMLPILLATYRAGKTIGEAEGRIAGWQECVDFARRQGLCTQTKETEK